MGTLTGIAVKPGQRAPMQELESAQVTQAAGVDGDYRRGRPRNRQITVLSADVWQQVGQELDAELPWTIRRANLLVSGVTLPREIGAKLKIGDLELEVRGETAPCEYMDEQHQGLTAALQPDWRGGVCCKALNDAEIRLGDSVSLG